MKILEVRDGFIKFETDKNLCLSSFILLEGVEYNHVAQIIQLKPARSSFIGYAKILYLYNSGVLYEYDNSIPEIDVEIKVFDAQIINDCFDLKAPIIVGKFLNSESFIKVSSSAFKNNMLVSIDNKEDSNIITKNFVKQFKNLNKKVVIIDTLGIIDARKFVAGIDFKLPLNTSSLAFMYKECLNDATTDSKSTIIEIFKDLSEYSETVPFLPFNTLKNIIDEMVNKSHIFKLLVLKNKLTKFASLGYFANNINEVNSIKQILKSDCVVLDLSKLDTTFLNGYITYLFNILAEVSDTQVFLTLSNAVSKKNIQTILLNEKTSTTFVTNSKHKYLGDLKNIFKNFIIKPSFNNNELFNVFSMFLKNMPDKTCLVAGELTNYVPLLSSIENIEQTLSNESIEDKIEESVEDFITNEEDDEAEQNEKQEFVDIETLNDDDEFEQPSEIEQKIEKISNQNIEEIISEYISLPQDINMFDDEEVTDNVEDISEDINNTQNDFTQEFDDTVLEEIAEFEEIPIDNTNDEDIDQTISEHNIENIIEPEYQEIATEQPFETAVHLNVNEENENTEIDNTKNESIIDIPEQTNILQNECIENELTNSDTEVVLDNDKTSIEIDNAETLPSIKNDSNITETLETENENETALEAKPDYLENSEEIDLGSELSIEIDDEIANDINEIKEEAEAILLEEKFEEINEIALSPVETSEVKEIEVMQISDEDNFNLEEIVELDPEELSDEDIIIDIDDTEEFSDNIDEQIVKDVDKVFTTRKEDDISDTDLDFIDELNNDSVLEEISEDDNLLEEYPEQDIGILEETPIGLEENIDDSLEILETKNSSTPIVPVYDAEIPQEDVVISDPIEQGDAVIHAKYGSGVVEKMIKYGNKTLYSINFENVGRRLLDPTLTEIKKA